MGTIGRAVKRNAVAFLALAVALSGTAYAANTIGASDIQRNAVRSPHIKAGQVKPSDLSGSVRSLLSGGEQLQIKEVSGAPLFLASGEFGGAPLARCPAGYAVVGTGFNASIGEPGFVLAFGTFVGGFFANFTSLSIEANVQAICARNSAGGATTSTAAELRRFRHMVDDARAGLESSEGGQ